MAYNFKGVMHTVWERTASNRWHTISKELCTQCGSALFPTDLIQFQRSYAHSVGVHCFQQTSYNFKGVMHTEWERTVSNRWHTISKDLCTQSGSALFPTDGIQFQRSYAHRVGEHCFQQMAYNFKAVHL